jgi:rubrerythrin
MKEQIKLGMNKTGIDMAPILSKEMIEGTQELTTPLLPKESDKSIALNRIRFIEESEPVGSVPLPGTLKGAANIGLQILKGFNPEVFINKLGERLAFERSGVRLYDALISKHEAAQDRSLLPPIEKLQEFRNDELDHFQLLTDVMKKLGADPTAQTPAADISGVAAMGIQKVVTEARTNFLETLEAIIIAELADNNCWELLIQLTDEAGLNDISESFRAALEKEKQHLKSMKNWTEKLTLGKFEELQQAS